MLARFACGVAIALLGFMAAHAEEKARDIALPPIETVAYDERGRFVVNGQPFFPILLYGGHTDDASLAQYREFGFNTLGIKPGTVDDLKSKGFYAAMYGRKTPDDMASVLMSVGIDSPALNFKQDMLAKTIDYNTKSADAMPGRPVMNAIGYWEDEPKGVVENTLVTKEHYEDLINAIGVAAPYLYPVPYQPVSSVGNAVARAKAATGGKKPVLPILQIFAWEADARYPTPAELRCMAYLALVEGATGIGYYTYGTVTGHKGKTIAEVQPELWQSLKELNREVAELGPKFAAARESAVRLDGDTIDVKARSAGPGGPIVVVNSSGDVKPVVVGVAAKSSIKRRDGKPVDVKEGLVGLSLEPLEVVILDVAEAH